MDETPGNGSVVLKWWHVSPMLGHLTAFGISLFGILLTNVISMSLVNAFSYNISDAGGSSCVHLHGASVETLYTLLFHYRTLPGSHLRASWSGPDSFCTDLELFIFLVFILAYYSSF